MFLDICIYTVDTFNSHFYFYTTLKLLYTLKANKNFFKLKKLIDKT